MSQSPAESQRESTPRLQSYRDGWRQLYEMLRAGDSLSGRERNCCFLNLGPERPFADISAVSGFDFPDDARALAIVDWDRDGDQDVWIANRTAPRVRFLRNESANNNHFIQFQLVGTDCNRDAIGARLKLTVEGSAPRSLIQTIRAGQGFLSQSSRWVHFGLGVNERITQLAILWPGTKQPEIHTDLDLDRRYRIVQGQRPPALASTHRTIDLTSEELPNLPTPQTSRAIICARTPLPAFPFTTPQNETATWLPTRTATLVNLWATWCPPCVEELAEWTKHSDKLEQADLQVLALCVDDVNSPEGMVGDKELAAAREIVRRLQCPFTWGFAQSTALHLFEQYCGTHFDDARPFPLPTSFLLDRYGCVVAIYRGSIKLDQVLSDVDLLQGTGEIVRQASSPFSGHWLASPPTPQPLAMAKILETSSHEQAIRYLRRVLDMQTSADTLKLLRDSDSTAATSLALATIELQHGDPKSALTHLKQCIQYDPENFTAHANLGSAYFQMQQWSLADTHFSSAAQIQPSNVNVRVNRGITRMQLNRPLDARNDFSAALGLDPRHVRARYNLARVEMLLGNDLGAVTQLEFLLKIAPTTEVKHDLAWILATSPEATVRDGRKALDLARQVCQAATDPSSTMLRTLAAAQAAESDFDAATETLEKAIQLARSEQNSDMESSLTALLPIVQAQRPIRRRRGN